MQFRNSSSRITSNLTNEWGECLFFLRTASNPPNAEKCHATAGSPFPSIAVSHKFLLRSSRELFTGTTSLRFAYKSRSSGSTLDAVRSRQIVVVNLECSCCCWHSRWYLNQKTRRGSEGLTQYFQYRRVSRDGISSRSS